MNTLEEQIVRHVCDTSFEDLPEGAIEAARREVLWNLGTSFAGASAPGSELILDFAREMGGVGEATVIGYGERLAPYAAGFANGCFAKALEYEDKWWVDRGCAYAIGVAVIPAAFAMAEQIGGVNGKDFLAAIAVASDVQARLVKAVPKAVYSGWNPTYLFSVFGSAIVAGRLLGLNREEMHSALGLAYAQAAGNRQNMVEGTLGNRLQLGFGVRNGLTAARLAKLGATGAKEFLVGRYGMFSFFLKDTEVNLDALTEDLGRDFLGSILGFKAYPCCAATHPALDAVNSIIAQAPVEAASVEAVTILGSERMMHTVEPRALRQVPMTQPDAQFSVAWATACLIKDGELRLSHFTDATLGAASYAELSRKVETEMDLDRQEVSVQIRLKDGRILCSGSGHAPKGHPENPLSLNEIVNSYRDCVKNGPKALPVDRTERAKDLTLQLHNVSDVSEIVRLLA